MLNQTGFEKGVTFKVFSSYTEDLKQENSNKINILWSFYCSWKKAIHCCVRLGLNEYFCRNASHLFVVSQFISFFLCFFCVSCLSLNFNLPKDKKAKGVVFQPPPAPYTEITKEGMDSAYENSQNQNIIAFFSNCSSSARFSDLTEFQKDLLTGLKSFQVQNQTETLKENQKAWYLLLYPLPSTGVPKGKKLSVFKGKNRALDRGKSGHKSEMRLFIFKKGMCFYALSFLNRAGDKEDEKVFSHFIRGFKAP